MAYYAYLTPDPEIARAYVAMVKTVEAYLALARTPGPDSALYYAKAEQARRAYQDLIRDFELLSRRGAAKADSYIRDRIRQKAVRPQTTGRMAGAVHSTPLTRTMPGGSFPGGGVAIGDIARMDTLTVDPRGKWGEYWRAQEYGTDAHVGRKVVGFFSDSPDGSGVQSRPSGAEFRNHPYFVPVGKGPGGQRPKGTPAMVIKRPIEAKHFMRDGTAAFALWHEGQSNSIMAKAISRIP